MKPPEDKRLEAALPDIIIKGREGKRGADSSLGPVGESALQVQRINKERQQESASLLVQTHATSANHRHASEIDRVKGVTCSSGSEGSEASGSRLT